MSTTKELGEIATALRNGAKLSDAQVGKVAELRRNANAGHRWVDVHKMDLRPGEELWDFISALVTAVHTDRILLADGSIDAWLEAIFDDYVIVQDGNTGKLFKSMFVRNADGSFTFGEPVEVRHAFVEAGTVAKSAAPTRVNVAGARSLWAGVLPRRF